MFWENSLNLQENITNRFLFAVNLQAWAPKTFLKKGIRYWPLFELSNTFQPVSQPASQPASRLLQKTSPRRLAKTSSRRFQDVLQKHLQDIFKTSSRRFQDVSSSYAVLVNKFSRCLQDVFTTAFLRRTAKIDLPIYLYRSI